MNTTDNLSNNDPRVRDKARLAGRALFAFVACLAGALCLLSLNIPLVIGGIAAGAAWKETIANIAVTVTRLGGLCFTGSFLSFAFLIYVLVREPRGVDIRPMLTPYLKGFAYIFAGGVVFFMLVIMASLAVFLVSLYNETGNPILAALAFFCGAMALFAVSVTSALVQNVRQKVKAAETGASPPKIPPGGGSLSIAEKLLTAALSVVLVFIFQYDSLKDKLGGLLGQATGQTPSAGTVFYWLIALFIVLFSVSFIFKALKTLYQALRSSTEKRL